MQKKVVVEKVGIKKEISFPKILLQRRQMEFEKEISLEKTINEKLEDRVNQGLNVSTATEFIYIYLIEPLHFISMRMSLRTGDFLKIHMEPKIPCEESNSCLVPWPIIETFMLPCISRKINDYNNLSYKEVWCEEYALHSRGTLLG